MTVSIQGAGSCVVAGVNTLLNYLLAVTLVVATSLATAAPILFDFEELANTSPPRTGAYSSLSLSASGLTIDLSRPGGRFDIIRNTGGSTKPEPWGLRSLDPFFQQTSNTPFVINFSKPVSAVSIDMGDYGADTPDALRIEAFSGKNATGSRIDSATRSLPTLAGDPFNYRTVSVDGAGIQSIRFIGGTPSFPNSVFYDNIVATLVPQTLFLNFAPSTVNFEVTAFKFDVNYEKTAWDAGITTTVSQADVVSLVKNAFSPFAINVVTTRPTSGNYSTIEIGSALNQQGQIEAIPSDLVSLGAGKKAGIARTIDILNSDKNDKALVFPLALDQAGQLSTRSLAGTIAHEAGHILGLFHVADISQIMYPLTQAGSVDFGVLGGLVSLGEIDPNDQSKVITKKGTQDTFGTLACNVGLTGTVKVDCDGIFDTIKKYIYKTFGLTFSTLKSTLFDVIIGVGPRNGDAGPTTIKLAQVNPGDMIELNLPFLDDYGLFIAGKSSVDGVYDVFSLLSGAQLDFSLSDILRDVLPGNQELELFQQRDTGYVSFGSLALVRVDASSVPEPHPLLLLLIPVIYLIRNSRQNGSRVPSFNTPAG